MGIFYVDVEIGDPQGERFESVRALVDTGSAYTILPASVLEGLGVEPHDTRNFQVADGRIITRGFGQTWVRLDERENISPVVFWDEGTTPLLGAVTLEIFGLGIDTLNRRLVPVTSMIATSTI